MKLSQARRWAGRSLWLALVLALVGYWGKGRLPEPDAIEPQLLAEPRQEETLREPFHFVYKAKECRVRPVASYELAGLVVSHNDIESIADIYHDSTSVDTKDLCVVWGDNLTRDDYRRVTYRSGSFTCWFRYPEGVRFLHRGLSNNHLISDRPAIREAIARVRVGDQVHLEGLLVDYQMDDWREFWRRSSTTRDDAGGGACEVVFVEELTILRRATPFAYAAWSAGLFLLAAVPVLWLGLFWLEVYREGTAEIGKL